MKKIERLDKLILYGLVVLVLWGFKSCSSVVERPQGQSGTAEVEKVYPSGKIDGFFVYIVKGLPDDPEEPILTLTLTPIDEPDCNIVWALVDDSVHPWSFAGPYGCKGELKSFAYYQQKLLEALCMYVSGFEV